VLRVPIMTWLGASSILRAVAAACDKFMRLPLASALGAAFIFASLAVVIDYASKGGKEIPRERYERSALPISSEPLTGKIDRHNREESCKGCVARKLAFDPAKVLKLRPFSE